MTGHLNQREQFAERRPHGGQPGRPAPDPGRPQVDLRATSFQGPDAAADGLPAERLSGQCLANGPADRLAARRPRTPWEGRTTRRRRPRIYGTEAGDIPSINGRAVICRVGMADRGLPR